MALLFRARFRSVPTWYWAEVDFFVGGPPHGECVSGPEFCNNRRPRRRQTTRSENTTRQKRLLRRRLLLRTTNSPHHPTSPVMASATITGCHLSLSLARCLSLSGLDQTRFVRFRPVLATLFGQTGSSRWYTQNNRVETKWRHAGKERASVDWRRWPKW